MNQPWNNQNQSQGAKTSSSPKVQNFLESLKTNPFSAKGVPGQFESPFGANPFSEFTKQKELEKQRVAQFHQARLKEWEQVYSFKDKQIQKQIEQLREELKALAKQIVKYDQNVTQAIQTQVVNPGTYHVTFFEHLREIIALIRKNVADANSWLSTYKKRGKQKGAFWQNAKSGGSAYMFSGEHSITRSVG